MIPFNKENILAFLARRILSDQKDSIAVAIFYHPSAIDRFFEVTKDAGVAKLFSARRIAVFVHGSTKTHIMFILHDSDPFRMKGLVIDEVFGDFYSPLHEIITERRFGSKLRKS